MPGFNTRSNDASNSLSNEDKECLRMQRNADNMLFAMMGMVVTWLAWLVISLVELGG
jgi:hypothetical protein